MTNAVKNVDSTTKKAKPIIKKAKPNKSEKDILINLVKARLEQLEALPRWNDAIIQEYELLHCEIDNTTMDYVNSIMDRVA